MSGRVAVFGGGAMGGVWAARMAASGIDVTVVDPAEAVISAVTADGLRVERDGEELVVHPTVVPEPSGIEPVDVAFVFVKAYHTESVARSLPAVLGPSAITVSLQNGWGNADVLARYVDPSKLAIGVTYHSAMVVSAGHIRHTAQGATFVGPYGSDVGVAERAAAPMRAGGIEVTVSPTIRTEVWRKLILNAATLPTSALTRLAAGRLAEQGPTLDLVDGLATEAVAVAVAQGLDIDLAERIARIHAVLSGGGSGRSSMLQDVLASRRTEISVVNGAVVRVAHELGLDVPLNRAVVALIDGLERSWQAAEA